MLSYKFIVVERSNAVRLRITNNRKKAEINLGFSLSSEDLSNALSDRPRRENIKWRSALSNIQEIVDNLKVELMRTGRLDEDVRIIKEMVEREMGKTVDGPLKFLDVFRRFKDTKSNSGTKGVYHHTESKMLAFDPNLADRSFEEINLKWLTDFEAFCGKTASKNARNIHLRNIRAVFNHALDYEITTFYPFRRFKIRPEATRKRSLSVEELRSLFDYPVEEYAVIYRDLFKLIFLLIGINTVDLHGLKNITKDGRIEYKRAKTGRLYSIKVEPEALEIIEKYKGQKGLLCIADRWTDSRNFRHQINKAIQRFGEVERKGRGGKKIISSAFPEVTTYWARHTWATIASALDIPKDTIAAALGHGGNSVTDIYIDFDQRKVDEANRRVIDWVLYGKR